MSEAEAAVVPTHGSNKGLIIVVLVFNFLSVGALAYLVVKGQKSHTGDAQGEKHTAKAEQAPKFGPLVEVGSLIANLSGAATGHYVKVGLHVEAEDEEAKLRVEQALVPIRNEVIVCLSGLEAKAATESQIRDLAKKIETRLIPIVGKKTIKRVYFSELVIQ